MSNPVLTSSGGTSAEFGDSDGGHDGNYILLNGTTFPGSIGTGDYIKVIGSAKNDGYYKVKTKHSTTSLEVEGSGNVFTNETVTFSGTALCIHWDDKGHIVNFGNGTHTYYTHDAVSANTSNVDMSPHIWMGQNLYAQVNSDNLFSTSLEHGKDPVFLGWIADMNVASSNKADKVYIAKCKLVKPIRTTSETTIYVDDARNLSINEIILLSTEKMQITAIKGNTLTVTRGYDSSTAVTTSLDAYGITNATNANYLIHYNEEYDFSRTIFSTVPDVLSNHYKIVDGSGNSLSNADDYGGHLLVDTWKEASYVLRPFHLAMSYDNSANRISLFVDGREIDTQIFSEGNLRISSFVGNGSNGTVTVTTIDPHGLATNDWVKIESSGVTNLDGVWKVTVTADNTFTINCVNTVASATTTAGTLTDVTIRTEVNFQDFEFDATDCYMGSNGDTTLETRRSSQFMGEMHEFTITKEYKDQFNTLDTLVPNYRNTLLYFRFEGDES